MPEPLPQLLMELTDTGLLPDIPLPDGLLLRNYRPGDEERLTAVYQPADFGLNSAEEIQAKLLADPCFTPDRLFITEKDTVITGAACAWRKAEFPDAGYLHMVAVHPEYRGLRLGVVLTAAVIRYSFSAGLRRVVLNTDDWRHAALRLYLGLGFYPVCTHSSHPGRWEKIAEELALPDLPAKARDRR